MNFKNKLFWEISSAFALLVILIFCFKITTTYGHESENKNVLIVHISEKGFEPNKINIKIGDTVIFENTGDEDHWPASDDHPSHTLYGGTSLEEHCSSKIISSFDACTSIKKGESWPFVFVKEGVHKYHDHLWPQFVGEIIVTDSKDIEIQSTSIFTSFVKNLQKIFFAVSSFFTNDKNSGENIELKSGKTDSSYYTNLKNRYEEIVLQFDPREAISLLQDESSKDKQVSALCHDLLHVIGRSAFHKYGSFSEAVKYQSDFCNSGYIHGLFESYFNTVENPLSGLSEQCSNSGVGERQFDLWQCHHGIGHGFMYLTGGDLDKSLQLCKDGLQKTEAVSSCQNGAYMEVFNLETLAKENNFVNSKNPFLTCQARETNKKDCYLYIPSYLSQVAGMDFADIFSECDKAETGYKHTCINGIGSEAMKRNMIESESVFALCKQAGSYINQKSCVSGAVSMYMNQEGSNSAGKKLCETIPEFYQDICYETVNDRESFFR